jgi:hypothetical protein
MSDGIAEELLNLLAKVPDLKVATSPKARKGFLVRRPNPPARPNLSRTGTLRARSTRRCAHAG